ncbi:hypothetical protein MPLSOD_40436 [Mesorhizobium sp. SOD10]|nr:hypothetical protein MPLSOD_40436 [Mesorhizobium sp. SOD10]
MCETMHFSAGGLRVVATVWAHHASLDRANLTPAAIIAFSHSLISLRLREYRATVSGSQAAQAST